MKILVIASITALVLANEAQADALPFFSHTKARVKVGFENLHELPDFDFYLKCSRNVRIGDRDHSLKKVTSGSLTKLFSWGDLGTVLLVAVPRGQPMPGPQDLPKELGWIDKPIPGTLESQKLLGPGGVLSHSDDGCELHYHVRLDGQTLIVELVDAQCPFNFGFAICVGFTVAGIIGVAVVVAVPLVRAWRGNSSGAAKI